MDTVIESLFHKIVFGRCYHWKHFDDVGRLRDVNGR